MNELAAKIQKFWDNTNPRNAHLGISGERDKLMERFKFVGPVSGRRIIDFGCDGGNVFMACRTAEEYVTKALNRYKVKKKTEPGTTNCVTLKYGRIKDEIHS